MKVQEQDRYHGPALMQIVEHNSFKALNKADEQYGHYLVNQDTRLWLKYSGSDSGPWSFTFHPADVTALRSDIQSKGKNFVVLACGHHTICCLSEVEIASLIDLGASAPQWVKVESPEGKQMRVTGSLSNKKPILAAHSKFPNCIF